MTDIAIGVLAAGFLGVAIYIVIKQRRAASCDLHDKRAGHIAILLSVVCLLISIALTVAMIWL